MKIKLLTLLSLIITANTFAANSPNENIKLMQLYIDKNQLEKVEDLYDEEEDTLSKNWMAMERLAISFERREKFKEAIEVYRKIITNFNKEAHQRILATPASKMDSSSYDKTKLQLYYYKLAFLNTQLFSKTSYYTQENERNKFKKNAEGFIGLSRKVKVDEGDCLYLFSDGYADQFGGPKGKKFMVTNLQKTFLANVQKPMHIQKQNLTNAFISWKSNAEQIDDVLVIGITI